MNGLDPARATQIVLFGHSAHGYDEAFLWLGADHDDGDHSMVVLRVDTQFGYRAATGIEKVLRRLGA